MRRIMPRLHIPGRPDVEPEVSGRQSYVTAHHHNEAMGEIDRCLRSADGVLARHQAEMDDIRMRVAVLTARHEALERVLSRCGVVVISDIAAEAEAVMADWRALAEGVQDDDKDNPDNPTTDEEAAN